MQPVSDTCAVANSRPKRSRKSRSARGSARTAGNATGTGARSTAGSTAGTTAGSATRHQQRAARIAEQQRQAAAAKRTLGTVGDRPLGIFGDVPVSEFAILIGLIGIIVGVLSGGGAALIVGVIVCAVGVFEVTAREHFSGYRSHATLLAAAPSVLVEALIAILIGVPSTPILLFAPVIPIFALSFWQLRRVFQSARHNRVTRLSSS